MIDINKLNTQALDYISTVDEAELSRIHRQLDAEYEMSAAGQELFKERVLSANDSGQAINNLSVRRNMSDAIVALSEKISAFVKEASSGKAGKKHSLVKYIKILSADQVSFITVSKAFAAMYSEDICNGTYFKIGDAIMSEIQFKDFVTDAGDYGNRKLDHLKEQAKYKQDSVQYLKKTTAKHLEKNGSAAVAIDMSRNEKASIGCLLVAMLEETGFIVLQDKKESKMGSGKVIRPSPMLDEVIKNDNYRLSTMFPEVVPMLCRPVPWTSVRNGGYFTLPKRYRCVMKNVGGAYLDELEGQDLSAVFEAINAVQDTAWAINKDVLGAMQHLVDIRAETAGLPSFYDNDKAVYPEQLSSRDKSEWSDEDFSMLRAWVAGNDDVEKDNRSNKSKAASILGAIELGNKLKDEEEFFFPAQLDSRGRMYTLSNMINPQGSDYSRGLLEFANAMPIADEQDRRYLCVHITGMYGYDKKVSIEQRVQWCDDNIGNIMATEADPISMSDWWGNADAPFQFLAAVIDYARFKKEGFGYLSCLPIQFDGSCNGLQNFSAMLKDEIGGEATNLTPSEKPSDIYDKVAVVVTEICTKDLFSDDAEVVAMAKAWLEFGISRKVCKRPVMTLAYGASKYGFTEQVFEDTVVQWRKNKEKKHLLAEVKQRKVAMYLADKIWEAVCKVVVKAAEAMEWLQNVAGELAKKQLPVYWHTADGLPVMQFYKKKKMKRIKVTFGSTTIFTSLLEDDDEVDMRKQASAIAPNFIHSCDATHMRKTIVKCKEAGMKSFSMIHDSYGCHVGAAFKMSTTLREQFIDMYSVNLLEKFKVESEEILDDKISAPLPVCGSLDLSLVLESDFFFS